MFMLNSLQPGSFRFFSRCVLTIFVVFALVFSGCDTEPNGDPPSLHGTWADFDSFIININDGTLEYDDGGDFGMGYTGTILKVTRFNSEGTAGVILIKYDSDNKPSDFDWSDPENPIPIAIPGDYIGIFFRNLTNTTGQFANPINEHMLTPAKSSLVEAEETFTLDSMNDFVSWVHAATYTKQ